MNNGIAVDLARIPNPYDFANPVSNKDLFIGRDNELKDIKYYLDHARNAPRSINLALLGERAAGKTSLLNIIEFEAIDRGLVPVRIDLNESDVETHFSFWLKLFDAIVSRIIEEPTTNGVGKVFGGVAGGTYDVFLDLISAYVIPDDKTFCPFLFPVQFAKAMGSGNSAARVSDQILKRDLKMIADEVGRPIVLLIDECNILSAHRSLLEMVRNTFMNLRGYMLVFTGTPDLFPLMDDVFSPIVRQFKRIEVAPFADICETRNAVVEPLKSVGQECLFETPPEHVLKSLPRGERTYLRGDLDDLHALTGGRPHEIQLVCHFMFRRVQRGSDKSMRLSLEVLDDVLRELRQSHDVESRPIISAIKSLDGVELRRLALLLRSGGNIPVKQLIFAAVTTKMTVDDPNELTHAFARFVELGILSEIRGCACFRGDDVDRIVCKYAARQRNIHLSFESKSFGKFFMQRIFESAEDIAITADKKRVRQMRPLFRPRPHDSEDHTNILSAAWPTIGSNWTIIELCRQIPTIVPEMYEYFSGMEEDLKRRHMLIRIEASGCGAQYTGYLWRVKSAMIDSGFRNMLSVADELKERAKSMGGSFEFEVREIEGATVDELLDVVVSIGDDAMLKECVESHASSMVRSYVREKDIAAALIHARRAAKGLHVIGEGYANGIGYVLLSCDRLSEAASILQTSNEPATQRAFGKYKSLAKYNLGVVRLKQNDYEAAHRLFEEVVQMEREKSSADIIALLVPKYCDGTLVFEELRTKQMSADSALEAIDLADAARGAIDVLERIRTL